MNIVEVATDKNLAGPWFKGESWGAWFAFLSAVFALPPTEALQSFYERNTGRVVFPSGPSREAWVVVGRRGGKSLIAALVAVYLACFREYSGYLAPGEVATVMVIAADRRQARVVMRYIAGFLEAIPLLKPMIGRRTQDTIELSNRVVIEVHTANFRAIRGYTIIAAICDEIAFWRSEESASPDTEILNGLRPGMATIPSSLLLCISSPYARRGALWEAYRKHYGKDGPVLVWQAATRDMNPNVPEATVTAALEEDEPAARAEWFAEFRRDIESYVSREALEEAKIPHRQELPYSSRFEYHAFVDPSGGQVDSMTLAVAHRENGCAVLDLVIEKKPPFSPDSVTAEFCQLLKAYRCRSVVGDKYAGEWPRERFCLHGVEYKSAPFTKSEMYKALLPVINSRRVELLDRPRLLNQLLQLERRTGTGGREIIDHPPGGHDDVANAAVGACLLATGFGGPTGGPKKLTGV
jgi:hypothetical protein